MSGMKRTTEKNLMVFSGRAHPVLAEEVAHLLGTGLVPQSAYEFANSEIYVPLRGVRPRLRRVRDPEPHRSDQRVDHGAPDHGRRPQAGLGQADHRGHAVLRLRAPGQEAPRPRADLGAPGRRPLQDRRRRPADHRRPARRPDPGLLRRPGRPPDGPADPRRLRPPEVRRRSRSPSSRPTPAGSRSPSAGRPASAAHRWPSSTRPATSTGPTRSAPTASSVRSTAGSACWSTT